MLTAELAETAEVMMIINRYNFSANSTVCLHPAQRGSAVGFLYVFVFMKLCTKFEALGLKLTGLIRKKELY